MSFNSSGFTIHGGAFNHVQGAQHNDSTNHIASDMNSYQTDNHGDDNVTNSGANYVARPRRGKRRPRPAPRDDDEYEVEEEYYRNRPRMPYYPASDPNDVHHPPYSSMLYGGYGPEPPYPRREHYDPNDAYASRHTPPPRPAPQSYPGDYDPRDNPQHQNYRDDRQQPPPRDYYEDRGYARPPPAHYDRYYDPQSPHPQYYPPMSPPSGAPRPEPPPQMSSPPAEYGNQFTTESHGDYSPAYNGSFVVQEMNLPGLSERTLISLWQQNGRRSYLYGFLSFLILACFSHLVYTFH